MIKNMDVSLFNEHANQTETNLIGESLEVYLSMVIISKFMGQLSFPRTAISGKIGGGIYMEGENTKLEPRNWKFEKISGSTAKIAWAARSKNFDRLLLSGDLNASYPDTNGEIEIQYCYDLLNVVDTVFGDKWRRARYTRCPELAYIKRTISNRNKTSSIESDEPLAPKPSILKTINWLKSQKNAVSKCPNDIHVDHLLKAYLYLNNEWREETQLFQFSKKSISFLRLDGEEGPRFSAIFSRIPQCFKI